MKIKSIHTILVCIAITLTACSSSKPPDFPRKWTQLNTLQAKPEMIPLVEQHTYKMTILDSTVKELVTRWGKESNFTVSYDYPYDFTLFEPVKLIHRSDLNLALADLSSLYEPYGVRIYMKDKVIFVKKK